MTSDVGQRRSHGSPAGTATLDRAAALRWREPRLAAELAQQVLGDAAARGDAETWLRAAGWLLHGRSAIGDARDVALDLLGDLDTQAGRDVLRGSGAARLRVELAALAQTNGDPEIARDMLDGWLPAGPDAGAEQDELELDRLAVLVRCALVDGSDELAGLRAEVEALSGRLDGEPAALAELLLGSVHRDDGEPAAAAERALRGLVRLGWTPADPASPPRSPHLGCALLSQWATALLEDGAAADIPDGVKQFDVVDGGRHGVLWRLAVARAFAGRARPTADVLEDAASAAAAVDAPSLEAACRSAQAELFEGAGRFQDALTAVRAAMAAERTDRERAERLREALAGPAEALAADGDEGVPGLAPSGAAVSADDREPVGDGDVAGSALATLDVRLDAFDDTPPDNGPDGPGRGAPAPVVEAPGSGDGRDTGPGRGIGREPAGGPEAGPSVVGASDGGAPGTGDETLPASDGDWQLPGSRGADAVASEGSPLADALLAELREAVRDLPGSAESSSTDPDTTGAPAAPGGTSRQPVPAGDRTAPETGETDGRDRDARGPTIVLDLVDSDGRPVRHRDTGAVAADLAARAERLVPADSDVRGPEGDDRAVAGSLVEVSVRGAEEVAVRLWARSLLGHLASRVPRRGLPDGTVLRARVHVSGQTAGDAQVRPLQGPAGSAVPGLPGPAEDAASAPTNRRTGSAGRSALADLDVAPGSGGRRRKVVEGGDDEPAGPPSPAPASADGATTPVNGASVEHLLHRAAAEPGTGGGGPDGHVTGEEAGGRRARRRRADGGARSASAELNGVARPYDDRAGAPRHGAQVPDDGAGEPGGARSPDEARPAVNGRVSHTETLRAAVELPGSAGSANGTAPTNDPGDAGTGGRRSRRPDPLDTSVPVEDAVPDGAVWLRGSWVVPGPVEEAAADAVRLVPPSTPDEDDRPRSPGAGENPAAADGFACGDRPVRQARSGGRADGDPGDDPVDGGSVSRGDADDEAPTDGSPANAPARGPRHGAAGSGGPRHGAGSGAGAPGSGTAAPAPGTGAPAPGAAVHGSDTAAPASDTAAPASGAAAPASGAAVHGSDTAAPGSGSGTGARESGTGARESGTGARDSGTGARESGKAAGEPGAAARHDKPDDPDAAGDPDGRAEGAVRTWHTDRSDQGAAAPDDQAGSDGRGQPRAGASPRRDRRSRTDRRSSRNGRGRDVPATGADPTAIPDDLGLGDLLAGALAAYRESAP